MKKIFNKIFPKRFGNEWKKIKNFSNIDEELKFITNSFINSKSYKLVSNYWHVINIENYKNLAEFGIKKYGSTLARTYYTFTELHHDEWFNKTVDNIKDSHFTINSTEVFKKQDGFSLKESINYNYLCYFLFYNLKKTNVFKYIQELQDKTYIGFNDPYIKIDDINITTDKIVSFSKANNFLTLSLFCIRS